MGTAVLTFLPGMPRTTSRSRPTGRRNSTRFLVTSPTMLAGYLVDRLAINFCREAADRRRWPELAAGVAPNRWKLLLAPGSAGAAPGPVLMPINWLSRHGKFGGNHLL